MSRSVRASTPADAPAIKALFAATGLQPNADSRSLQWKYWQERSDWSAPRSFVLTGGEEIVAHGAIVPGAFLFGEERITTAHVIVGALTLATTFWLTWRAHRDLLETSAPA